jgi:hypothetical protein
MTPMPTTKVARMTPETEQRIVEAVDETLDMVAEGEAPDDAICKAAADLDLSPGHVGLLVNAYNTGRTNHQRTTHAGLTEKAAEFPLADLGAILERLYPAEVKSAAAAERASGVHRDYDGPPTWHARVVARGDFIKAASSAPPLSAGPPPTYPGEPAAAMKRAYHEAIAGDREVEEKRRLLAVEQDAVMAGFAKLARHFATPGSPAIADVRPNVEARWGDAGAAVLNQLSRTRPGLAKRAAAAGPPGMMDRGREPYRSIEEVIARAERARAAEAAYAAAADANATKAAGLLAPFATARRESPLGLPPPAEKRAGPYATALGVQLSRDVLGGIGEKLRGPDRDAVIARQLRDISSPEHEQALRGIHTQAMLHEMLDNDPIISSYHPSRVTDAFNDVSQLAPHASQQPAVMGPLLRKWLQQGDFDTFEGDQLAGTEQKLKNIHQTPVVAPPVAAAPKPAKPKKD